MHNISFALTTDQVRQRTKTRTRRDGWLWLVKLFEENLPMKSGLPRDDGVILRGIVKGQGLKKGEHPERITCIKATAARREPLNWITAEAVTREGFPGKDPDWFIHMYCDANGGEPNQEITAIQFTYPWRVRLVSTLQGVGIVWADSEHDARLTAASAFPDADGKLAITNFTDDLNIIGREPARHPPLDVQSSMLDVRCSQLYP
jgi:hypothetical protein